MYLTVSVYKSTLRLIGVVFICLGVLLGYSAFEALFDPSVKINLNGAEQNEPEAKMFSLILPLILILAGAVLCTSKGENLTSLHKARETFWSIFMVNSAYKKSLSKGCKTAGFYSFSANSSKLCNAF